MKNEEDIKLKVVYPFLKDLGITEDEIQFEYKFSFRLGTNTFKVGGKENRNIATGYSDILCKQSDKNLFVIEVKDQDIDISEDDINQAISYARLVTPIAPFSIVTNGKNTLIFDTITKTNITDSNIAENSTYWSNGLKLSIDQELRQRFLAIQYFVGYSAENIAAFSRAQVDNRLLPLRGDRNSLYKKYIPELFIVEKSLINDFRLFINSDSQLFALTGESGVGKTNAMCFLVEHVIHEHIVFFFNGTELTNPLFTTLKDDCNWFFSPHLEVEEIFSKLKVLTNDVRKLIIFIDAIDEIMSPNFPLELNDISKRIKKYPNIKLCVSCKSNTWPDFIKIKGNPSSIIDIIFNSEQNSTHSELIFNIQNCGIKLSRFELSKIDELDILYRNIYHYKGSLSNEIKNELRLGLTFKLFATVFANKKVPKRLNDINLFEEYLQYLYEKLGPEKASNYLIEIADAIFTTKDPINKLHPKGYVDERSLRNKLNLNVNESLYPELFSFNVLTRIRLHDSSIAIGFYYSRLRNYLIAIKVLKLNTLDNDCFESLLDSLIHDQIGQEVLLWYYESTAFKHHEIINKHILSNALIFVNHYEYIINEFFLNIKNKFDPFSNGEIGLLINNNLNDNSTSYGFYPITDEQNGKICVVPLDITDFNTFCHKNHVRIIRGEYIDFLSKKSNERAEGLIIDQLYEILKKGELFESNSIGILEEKILSIVYFYYKKLDIHVEPISQYAINFKSIFPLDLNNILFKIKYYYAKQYYNQLAIQELIDSNLIPVEKNGNISRYSIRNDQLNVDEINSRARKSLEENDSTFFNKIKDSSIPIKTLFDSINALSKYKSEILDYPLPPPDIIKPNEILENLQKRGGKNNFIPDLILAQYSDSRVCEYIEAFFNKFLEEYVTILDNNFSELKNKFKLFSKLPVHIHCELTGNNLKYCIKPTTDSSKITIELNSGMHKSFSSKPNLYDAHYTTFEAISWGFNHYPIEKNITMEKACQFCNIRNFIYDWIKTELKEIKSKLFTEKQSIT